MDLSNPKKPIRLGHCQVLFNETKKLKYLPTNKKFLDENLAVLEAPGAPKAQIKFKIRCSTGDVEYVLCQIFGSRFSESFLENLQIHIFKFDTFLSKNFFSFALFSDQPQFQPQFQPPKNKNHFLDHIKQ